MTNFIKLCKGCHNNIKPKHKTHTVYHKEYIEKLEKRYFDKLDTPAKISNEDKSPIKFGAFEPYAEALNETSEKNTNTKKDASNYKDIAKSLAFSVEAVSIDNNKIVSIIHMDNESAVEWVRRCYLGSISSVKDFKFVNNTFKLSYNVITGESELEFALDGYLKSLTTVYYGFGYLNSLTKGYVDKMHIILNH